jgi:hypothetical protein
VCMFVAYPQDHLEDVYLLFDLIWTKIVRVRFQKSKVMRVDLVILFVMMTLIQQPTLQRNEAIEELV